MIRKIILHIISGVIGFWLADRYIPGVDFTGSFEVLLSIGLVFGLLNFFIKPILNALTLPLRILTLGLFGIIINMAIIWLMDILFQELVVIGLTALFWTAVITGILGLIVSRK